MLGTKIKPTTTDKGLRADMKSVFLCHSSKDKPFVRQLAKHLVFHGLKVWLDEKEIVVGDSLSTVIESGLESCDYVIVALSKASLESGWVQKELRAAYSLELERERNVIVPVVLEKARLPLFLRDKKYADFSINFDEGLASVLTAFFGHDIPLQQRLKNSSCSIFLDIVRLDGSLARYRKKQTLKCIKGTVESYVEAMEATGRVTNFRSTNSSITETRWEGGLTHLTIQFKKALHEGDLLNRTFTCDFLDTFIDSENSWEEREYFSTDDLVITIRFPKGRPPLTWKAYGKKGPNVIEDLVHDVRLTTVKGKPALVFTPLTSKAASSYVIRWNW